MDALRLQWVGSDFIEDSFFPRKTAERPVLDCMDALSNSTPYYSSSRILPSKPGSGMVIAVKRFIQEVFQDYNDSNNSCPTVRIIAFQEIDLGSTPGKRIITM
ncbi:hypothetical protein V6N13_121969 [Hibiscus sabdariffa]